MKKQIKERHGRRNRTRKQTTSRIIFGIYQKDDGKEVVIAKSVVYPVIEIKQGIPLPIEQNAQVKALVQAGKSSHKNNVVVLKTLGSKLSLKEHILRILKEVEIPIEFSKSSLSEANSYDEKPTIMDMKNRTDLTKLALCTIDGESAKDFDDAVFATKKGNNIEVTVAIADVSYYVKASSSLDQEAYSRGVSIYYPGSCIPMLPEKLSNGLCSLKPKVPRLAIAVSFELGPKGGIFKPRIREAIIKSAARLTYNQVQDFYDHKPGLESIPQKIKTSLTLLQKASHILRKGRENRGAIDFDLIESVVALDDEGEPIAIHPQDRLEAHRMIEDLMVATNEIVAELFEKKHLPCLYRVHEPPDQEKLENFFKTAHAFQALDKSSKSKAASITEPKALQDVMKHYQKSKYKETLNTLMLRSMMQARYSEQNLMHFGLASTAYLHFTSPIRRYADLIIHRQLRAIMFEKNYRKKISEPVMAQIASSISSKEIKATEIERKIDRLYAATFMASRIGETFNAIIVSCTEFGFFVRIIEHHVEGLVHIATISKYHVNFLPEKMSLIVRGSHQRYMVGDKVLVKLINVNLDRGHVDFELISSKKG
jgi:ribonuclease R